MYEQALAEFTHSPSVETITQISIPLIKAAYLRVLQDSQCSKDPSIRNSSDAPLMLESYYAEALSKQTEKHLNTSLGLIMSVPENEENGKKHTSSKVKAIAQQSLTTDLPLPDWINFHGMHALLGITEKLTPTECKTLRDEVANKYINI